MIAHNRDNACDIFQISPGKTAASLRLAYQARKACHIWKANVPNWNESPERKGCKPRQRTKDVHLIPPKALHLRLEGENVLPVYKKPFDLIAVGVETGDWYA
jgi:hypothetical protein